VDPVPTTARKRGLSSLILVHSRIYFKLFANLYELCEHLPQGVSGGPPDQITISQHSKSEGFSLPYSLQSVLISLYIKELCLTVGPNITSLILTLHHLLEETTYTELKLNAQNLTLSLPRHCKTKTSSSLC
jgi:hypothetical protein